MTLAPHSIKAVYVRCGANERCLLYERPHKLARKGLRLHNASATIKTRRDFRLYLTNTSKRPVNLPKNFAVWLAIPYDGPVYEAASGDLSLASEEAKAVATLGQDQGTKYSEAQPAESVDTEGQAGDASRPAGRNNTVPDGQTPTPRVAFELISPALHDAVRDLMDQYKGLWDGQLRQIEITPQRITLTDGAKPMCQGQYLRPAPEQSVAPPSGQ